MPHLSPMNWIIMLISASMLMLVMSSSMWWKQQQKMNFKMKTNKFNTSKWNWL